MLYKGRKITAVEVSRDSVMVDWTLGNTCNYSCDYCFPGSNTGTHRMPPMSDLIRGNILHLIGQLKSVRANAGKKITFVLGGGEPTLYQDLPELLRFIGEHGYTMMLTNASRTLRWWEEQAHGIDELLISYHVGQADFNHVLSVARTMMHRSLTSIHVMLPPARLDDAARDYMSFVDALDGSPVRVCAKVIQSARYPVKYDHGQNALIDNLPRSRHKVKPIQSHMEAVMRFEDGGSMHMDDPVMIKDLSGSFKGYGCFAHQEFISILGNGACGRINCDQWFTSEVNLYGEGFSEEFRIPDDGPVECLKGMCGCVGLYMTNKLDPAAAGVSWQ